MQKRLFIILLLLFHLGQGYAVLSLSMSNLNITNGLSNNYVKDVAQDRQGFIWIATEAGLNRFDGCQFTRYTSTNSELKTDAINTLLSLSYAMHWILFQTLEWYAHKTQLHLLQSLQSLVRSP